MSCTYYDPVELSAFTSGAFSFELDLKFWVNVLTLVGKSSTRGTMPNTELIDSGLGTSSTLWLTARQRAFSGS